ncbi:MAG: hypothetical protein HKUEN07_12260 [Rhodocyclaceae bacterium]|jgi:hypothetical protein|uniref:Uncharacterized protein n=1 Tax=Candidatus Desulfobacillus denitrificans TaxID=2608985 RepID=A0A809S145_9PROT|nr:MAG: hypothetical protein B6D47_07210 [Rhodocyclaceae bacterium UTPRO2]BBO22156.1 conserved hypothetical protein [Candidatus Desulfobacillus denitrificans]GIK47067.1 MAG: hypothetical protein BroJett012_29700 [Betaproteobacteria bacterium]GJQ54657.1 MAG: hypothetical protein HKUEN07_12260 [Rhodocyclaceae bacterium]
MADVRPPWRVPLLILGFASLIVGVGAGLLRLGWSVPQPAAALAAFHGPLMVSGFFGTVISLERAVALARRWAYLGPLAAGAGGLALILGAAPALAQVLLALGSAGLLAGSVSVFLRQRALFTFTLAAGAASWLTGNLLWLGGFSVYEVVPWWAGFLVLTIAGERLELSRFLPPSPIAQRAFAAVLAGLTFGMALQAQLFGAALVALTLWLLRQDIARRTVKEKGLTRFIAVCLLSGYAWLAVAGTIMLGAGLAPGSAAYDAALHALMLGFVFSMVFGHAPIIFPAVLRVAVPYHPLFYAPLALLHLSLLVRLAGDAASMPELRSAGGLLNAVALAAFILNTVAAVIRGGLRKKAS